MNDKIPYIIQDTITIPRVRVERLTVLQSLVARDNGAVTCRLVPDGRARTWAAMLHVLAIVDELRKAARGAAYDLGPEGPCFDACAPSPGETVAEWLVQGGPLRCLD